MTIKTNNNLDDSINNVLTQYTQLKTEEKDKIFNVIKHLVGIDQKVNQEVQRSKDNKKCFSHNLCEDFCKGIQTEINKPELSHVVADNQLKKFQNDYGDMYKKSFKLYDKLSTEIKIVDSTQAPVFVGFCKTLEKNHPFPHLMHFAIVIP